MNPPILIKADNHGEAVHKTLDFLLRHGYKVSPRRKPTRELMSATIWVTNPEQVSWRIGDRELNRTIAAIEVVQLVGQVPMPEVVRLNKSLWTYTTAAGDGLAHGNYGARVYGQLADAVRTLKKDPTTRQAVVNIFDGHRDLRPEGGLIDVPCTLSVQFMIRDRFLVTRTSMRSNDAWLGLPYDLIQFSALHVAVAQSVGVLPGPYHHTVGSMHIYERDVEKAWDLVVTSPNKAFRKDVNIKWSPTTIEGIGRRARVIAGSARQGHPPGDRTEWERHLALALVLGEHQGKKEGQA